MSWQSGRAAHPSVPPRVIPSGRSKRRGVSRWVAACALALLGVAAGVAAPADPSGSKPKPKASSFAPHHTGKHVYGTPIVKPILHKQKKRPHAATAPTAPAAPIK
jgi:hypothetical protein